MVDAPLLKDRAVGEATLPKDLIDLGAEDNHGIGKLDHNSGKTGGQVGQVTARQSWPSQSGPHPSVNEVLEGQAAVEAYLKAGLPWSPPC